MPAIALVALIVLSGCAEQRRSYRYSWGKIVVAPQADVNSFCREGSPLWDDGTRKLPGEDHAGCWDRNLREIWVVDSCVGARALTHELAHADGSVDPEGDGYEW